MQTIYLHHINSRNCESIRKNHLRRIQTGELLTGGPIPFLSNQFSPPPIKEVYTTENTSQNLLNIGNTFNLIYSVGSGEICIPRYLKVESTSTALAHDGKELGPGAEALTYSSLWKI